MQSATVRQTLPLLRWLLYIGSAFTFIAGIQLVALARHTDTYFAWTIRPPFSAAALGAFFWATSVFTLLSGREAAWVRARGAFPAAIAFTTLTLAATLISFDRLHFGPYPASTQFLTYVWIAVYVVAPPVLLISFILQMRVAGGDPPRGERLPLPFKVLLVIQNAMALAVGAALFSSPEAMILYWGWDLLPLTARVLGAWLLALGMVGIQAVWENAWERVRAPMISLAILGLLQVVAFAIFFENPWFDRPGAVYWIAYWLAVLVLGGYGTVESLRASWATGKQKAAEAA